MENDYDKQIAYLTNNPDQIDAQWCSAEGVFKFMGFPFTGIDNRKSTFGYRDTGCPSIIRGKISLMIYLNGEPNKELSDELRADDRVPKDALSIKVENLQFFKEWQEKVDALQTIPYEKWNINLKNKKTSEDGKDIQQ